MVRCFISVSTVFMECCDSYDRAFLLQFKHVCTGRPSAIPIVDAMWFDILRHEVPRAVYKAGASSKKGPLPVTSSNALFNRTFSDATIRPLSPSPASPTTRPLEGYVAQSCFSSPLRDQDGTSLLLPSGQSCRSSSPTEVGDASSGSPGSERKYPSDPPLDELDGEVRDARLAALESRLAALVAEAEVIKVEVKRLREAWHDAEGMN